MASTDAQQDQKDSPLTITTSKTVVVQGKDGKAALELVCVNGDVKVSSLPRNGARRESVGLGDLADAVAALKS